ncbi:hypothetical protein KR222_008536 [Zaprionus bogoriensis]|nr:hypothetical protein KR222_008536 [Zaprionus bogoriensis]
MSNLQDVPLAEPENMLSAEPSLTGPKTNSLKRFFKLGKKSNSSQEISEDVCEPEDDVNKDATKPGSISRFLTRLKGSNKSESGEQNVSSLSMLEESADRPLPNAKPTLKTSISNYWKLLFHRQKVANRQGMEAEQQGATELEQQIDLTEMQPVEMQQVQQEQQTDPVKVEDASTVTPATSYHDLKSNTPAKLVDSMPEIPEEVQVLAISDEIVDSSQGKNNE